MRAVFSECNQTCKRGYERAHAADVYADQERGIVGCKLRQENCRRYVADDLAGEYTEQQGIRV